MPGSSLPSSSSRRRRRWKCGSFAPPRPPSQQLLRESPPPMIVVAPCLVRSAGVRAIASVPGQIDQTQTPIGPFQITVLQSASASWNVFTDSGPISRPIPSSGILSILTVWAFASAAYQQPLHQSAIVGQRRALPWLKTLLTCPLLPATYRHRCHGFVEREIRPPVAVCRTSNSVSITILLETLEPPIALKGAGDFQSHFADTAIPYQSSIQLQKD